MLGSKVLSFDLSNRFVTSTLNYQGGTITINLDPSHINGDSNIIVDASLVHITASNGVVHAINSVLVPPSLSNSIVDLAVDDDSF